MRDGNRKVFWVEQKSHQSREQGPTWCRRAVLPPGRAGKDRHVLLPRLRVPHTLADLMVDQGLHQSLGFRGSDNTAYRTPSPEGCAQCLLLTISLHPLSSSGATLVPPCRGGEDTVTCPRPRSTGRGRKTNPGSWGRAVTLRPPWDRPVVVPGRRGLSPAGGTKGTETVSTANPHHS